MLIMHKRILVSGGAGFIPSHLCKRLLSEGNRVVCIDNISTGNKRNIVPLLSNENFRFIKGDVRKKGVIDQFAKDSLDEIYHMASPASVSYIVEHPIEAATVNSIGTLNLLDIAMQKGIKILFTSSSEAYGEPKVHPQKESYWGNVNPIGIRSGYDEGKRFGEAITMAYKREKNLNVKIVRIFNTYGPNSSIDDSRVIPSFIVHALQNRPLPVHGDGGQTRSFCFVSDMVDGIIKMMESNETGPINLGNTEEYRIIDIASKIRFLTNSSSKIIFVERPKNDPSRRKPDICLAKMRLGWNPKVSFDEGLEKTIKYFKEII